MSGERSGPPEGSSRWTNSHDGLKLHYRAWELSEPRGTLLIVHGLGEHSARYRTMAADLRARGFSVYALDLRGHGRSQGRRGHVRSFLELVADVRAVLDVVGGAWPRFLLGHSLGGLVVLRVLQSASDKVATGAVLSAPALALPPNSPRWKRVLGTLLSPILPTLPLANGIDPLHLSHDPDVVAAYRSDPLVHDRVTPRFFTEASSAMARALAEADRVRVPLLLLAPGEDRVVAGAATLELADKLGERATLKRYPGLFHESLNELGRDAVVDDVAGWLEDQCAVEVSSPNP